jgi:hypothetical protein
MDRFSLALGAAAGGIIGFALGYGVRAWMSHRRRRKAWVLKYPGTLMHIAAGSLSADANEGDFQLQTRCLFRGTRARSGGSTAGNACDNDIGLLQT